MMTNYDAAVLANLPVAYFRLDEASGDVVGDASPNGHRGRIEGGVTRGAPGPFPGSRSMELDGTTGHIALDGTWAGRDGELTIEAWIHGTRTGNEGQAVVSAVGGEFVHFQLSDDPAYRNAIHFPGGYQFTPVTPATPASRWRHLVLSIRPGVVDLYEDGQLLSSAPCNHSAIVPTSQLRIGSGFGGGRFFAGRIGPVAIYDRALTAEQVAANFAAAQPAPDTLTAYDRAVLLDAPIAYFDWRGADVATAHDVSGHGRTGRGQGGVSPGDGAPFTGGHSITLDGTTGHVALDGTWAGRDGELTIEAWIHGTRTGNEGQAVVSAVGGEFVHFQLSDDPAYRNAIHFPGGYQFTPVTPATPASRWRHLVLSIRPGVVDLYEDGQLLSSAPSNHSAIVPTSQLRIGSGFGGGRFFAGHVGPVALYDRALGLAAVQAHYRAASDQQAASGESQSMLYFGTIGVQLVAESGSTTLEGSLDSLPLTNLVEAFVPGLELPPELPELTLSSVSVALTPTTGGFSVSGSVLVDWKLGGQMLQAQASVSASRKNSANEELKLSVTMAVTGPIEIAPGLTFRNLELVFSYDKDASKWTVEGGVSARLFDVSIALSAAYATAGDTETLTLCGQLGDSGLTLVDLGGVASLEASKVAIELKETTSAEGEKKVEWSLTASSGLKVLDLIDINGTLELAYEEDEQVIGFSLDGDSKLTLPLVPAPPLKLPLALEVSTPSFFITRTTTAEGKHQWSLRAGASAALKGLPSWVHQYLFFPRKVTATVTIDHTGAVLKADGILEPLDITLPDIDLGGGAWLPTSKLGTIRVHLGTLTAKLNAKTPELTLTTKIGLPSALNQIFGVDGSGNAMVDIFKTFDPKDADATTIGITFGAGVDANGEAKVVLRIDDSPLRAIVIKDGVWIVDLGQFGAFEVDIPTFSYEEGKLTGGGGLRITRDIALPLTPAKSVLTQVVSEDFAALFPDKLPLMDFNLYDDAGRLSARKTYEHLCAMATALGMPPVPKAIEDALNIIATVPEGLPNSLKPYLGFQVPRSLSFDLQVGMDASFSVNIWSEKDRPVRALIPAFTSYGVIIHGVTISRLSFGPVVGGSLFSLQYSGVLDVFDPVTLAAGLLVPDNQWVPSGRHMVRQLVVDDLLMLIVMASGVPIPIPVFYGRMRLRWRELAGIELSAGVRFPMPKLSITDGVRMISAVRKFCEDPAARLPMIEASAVDLDIVQVAVGSAQHVWAINASGQILQRATDGSGTWAVVEGPRGPTSISVGADGTAWVLAGEVPHRREAGGSWKSWSTCRLSQLDAASHAHAVGVDARGSMLRYDATTDAWSSMPEAPAEHVARSVRTDDHGVSWMLADFAPAEGPLDRGRIFYALPGGGWTWDPTRRFSQLATGSGSMHAAIGIDGKLHLYTSSPGWHTPQLPLPAGERIVQVDIDAEGDLWAVGQGNGLFQRVGDAWQSRGKTQGALPSGLDLRFAIEDVYLELPGYLGGSTLGKHGDLIELSAIRTVSGLMNAIKFGSVNDLMQILDLQFRKGLQKLGFFFIDFEAQWLLCTPREFREGAAASIGIAGSDATTYLGLVPAAEHDEGLVVFARGGWQLAGGLGSMETAIGTMATAAGFVTGFRSVGRIAGLFDASLQGRLQIETKGPSFRLEGSSHLDFAGIRVFESSNDMVITGDRFGLAGSFQLLPKGAPLQVSANLQGSIGPSGVLLDGRAAVNNLLPGVLASSDVHIDNSGVSLGLGVFGSDIGRVRIVDAGGHLDAEFQANLGVMASHHRLRVSKDGRGGSYTFDGHVGPLSAHATLSVGDGAKGACTVDFAGHRLLTGSMSAHQGYLLVSGDFSLLPAGAPLRISGHASGTMGPGGFGLDGQVSMDGIAAGILASSDLHVGSDGIDIGMTMLGQSLGRLRVGDGGGHHALVFDAGLGPVQTHHELRIEKNGSGGSYQMSGTVGPLSMNASLELGQQTRGSGQLSLFGNHLLSGTVEASASRFAIRDGMVSYQFPPGAPIVRLDARLEGAIEASGLSLYGSGSASFGIGGLPFGSAEAIVDISNEQATVELGIWILGMRKAGVASIRTFQGKTCFMAGWLDGVEPNFFFQVGNRNRLIVWSDGGITLNLGWATWGDDWPDDLKLGTDPVSFGFGGPEPDVSAAPPIDERRAELGAMTPHDAVMHLLSGGAKADDETRQRELIRALNGLGQPLSLTIRPDGEVAVELPPTPKAQGIAADLERAVQDGMEAAPVSFSVTDAGPTPPNLGQRPLIFRRGAAGHVIELAGEGDAPAVSVSFDPTRPDTAAEDLGRAVVDATLAAG